MVDSKILPFDRGAEAAPKKNILKVEHAVVSRAGSNKLDGVNFSVDDKGITALLGPNGAGKSLILRLIAGLIKPDSGYCYIAPEMKDRVALVFQKPVLLRRSVKANLEHALKIYGVPKTARSGRIAELLVMADLTAQAETPARSLSGGEQQRLAMARALASDPKMLLLDEPAASLDPRSTADIESLTLKSAEAGIKVILVSHDYAQARRLADDVLFLNRGRICEHTPASTFFEAPTSEEARSYVDGALLL